MNPYRLRAYILLVIVSVIWALAGPIIKFALGGLDSATFLTYRFGLSAVFGLTYMLFSGLKIPKDSKTWLAILIYGFLTSTVALGLLFFGLENTTVIDMSLISVVGPVMVAIAGVKYLGEHITRREQIGMGIAILGMILTIIEPILAGDGATRFSGNILILLYLLANAASVILLKKLLRQEINPLTLTNLSFIIGFLTISPIALIKFGPNGVFENIINLPLVFHLGVIYMAFLSGTLAYWLGNVAQKTIEVSEAALFSYLYPILSIPIAVLWLKEKITPIYLLGAAIILIGVIIAEYKKRS